jgi:hypothetical protein
VEELAGLLRDLAPEDLRTLGEAAELMEEVL